MTNNMIEILMKFHGTFINCAALLVAASIGSLIGKKFIPKEAQSGIMQGLGLACILLGIVGSLSVNNALYCIISFAVGGFLGKVLQLEKRLTVLLNRLTGIFAKTSVSDTFVEHMIGYTLMSVTGSMAISGPIDNALTGNINVLLAKTVLDVTAGFLFAASNGVPVICSTVLVFVYQMFFGLLAVVLSPVMTASLIADMSAIGSILILILGLNLTNTSDVKTMDYTLCIFIPILLHLLFG